MNKTVGKILILSVVLAIVVTAILVFYPTIIAPPVDVPITNLHKSSLEENINGFSEVENTAFNDSIYSIVVDKLVMYKAEGFMTDEEIDFQTKALVQKYLPIFTKLSNEKFMASRWNESDHIAMLDRIAHLRSLNVDYGVKSVVTGSYANELMEIEKIINNYREAKKVAYNTIFISVSDANKKIDDANRFYNMSPLSNCIALKEQLSKVKSNIGRSHYNKIKFELNKMVDYKNMSKDDFVKLSSEINRMINEYNTNRFRYGNDAQSIDSLKNIAGEYYREAMDYYNNKKIEFDTNNEWMEHSASSDEQKIFMSYSNYKKDYSSSTMYFTISGYTSFTFDIASSAEKNCDYVMVGVGYKPSISRNDANTKSDGNDGYYKSVTINNLDSSTETKIYVVYYKDDSYSKGEDRGYIKINLPKK